MSSLSSPESKSRRDLQNPPGRLKTEGTFVEGPKDSFTEYGSQIIQSNAFNGGMMVITIWALFGDDIKMLCTDKSADPVFDAIAAFALVMFCIELGLFCAFKKRYVWHNGFGYYFLLDVAACLSMVPDITVLMDLFTRAISGGRDPDDLSPSVLSAELSQTSASGPDLESILAQTKASKVGTRTTKIVRVVRLVRLVRVAKLVKASASSDLDLDEAEVVNVSASNVGKKLTELTTKKLVILVLLMVIFLPFLDGSLDASNFNEYQDYGLHGIHRMPQDYNDTGKVSEDLFRAQIESYCRAAGKIVYLRVCENCENLYLNSSAGITSKYWRDWTIRPWLLDMKFQLLGMSTRSFTEPTGVRNTPSAGWTKQLVDKSPDISAVRTNYRVAERSVVKVLGCYNSTWQPGQIMPNSVGQSCRSIAVFDIKDSTQEEAQKNILKTFFIMIVLIVGSIRFTNDAQTLVIDPLERMIGLFEKLAKDPLRKAPKKTVLQEEESGHEDFETAILEKTMGKITALLKVGFGAAGADVISANVEKQGELDVMVKGKKVTSVFGFGKIFDFTPTVSALGEEICMFINTIANLVHTPCHDYYGFANKNIGSAFLLTWKICRGVLPGLKDPRDPPGEPTEEERRTYARQRLAIRTSEAGAGKNARIIYPTEMVDSSLCAFIKILVDNYKANYQANEFHEFINNENMLKEFGKEKFKVRLGLGLHIGWAIEGPIGSQFKIDASYLSPNVNMAARLEAATEQFQTNILLSEWLVGELSPAARAGCRMIDRVTVKGSQVPMSLYTYDIHFEDMKIYSKDFLRPKFNAKGQQEPVQFESEEFKYLKKGIDPAFFEYFGQGMDNYLKGNWTQSKNDLEMALRAKPEDGPTLVLRAVMEKHGFNAPEGWKGHRALTSK